MIYEQDLSFEHKDRSLTSLDEKRKSATLQRRHLQGRLSLSTVGNKYAKDNFGGLLSYKKLQKCEVFLSQNTPKIDVG